MNKRMRPWLLLLLLAWLAGTLATVAAPPPPPSPSFVIVTGQTFGPLRENSSRAELDRIFGAGAVKDREAGVGEGFCVPGSVVYEGTPDEIAIAWRDATRTQIFFVKTLSFLHPSPERSRWITRRGVRVGTSLRQVERVAGQALTFSGFGWDYGGRALYREGRGELILWLNVRQSEQQQQQRYLEDYSRVSGDRQVRSDQPEVRRLPVYVSSLEQRWGDDPDESLIRDCTPPQPASATPAPPAAARSRRR